MMAHGAELADSAGFFSTGPGHSLFASEKHESVHYII